MSITNHNSVNKFTYTNQNRFTQRKFSFNNYERCPKRVTKTTCLQFPQYIPKQSQVQNEDDMGFDLSGQIFRPVVKSPPIAATTWGTG